MLLKSQHPSPLDLPVPFSSSNPYCRSPEPSVLNLTCPHDPTDHCFGSTTGKWSHRCHPSSSLACMPHLPARHFSGYLKLCLSHTSRSELMPQCISSHFSCCTPFCRTVSHSHLRTPQSHFYSSTSTPPKPDISLHAPSTWTGHPQCAWLS